MIPTHFEQNAPYPRFGNHGMCVFSKRDLQKRTRVCPLKPLSMRVSGCHLAMLFCNNAASNTQTRPPLYRGGGAFAAENGTNQ